MPYEAPSTIWWASLMVGTGRSLYTMTPFIGTEARFAANRALRCWDATGAIPNPYGGYAHSLIYDGGRWGIGRSDNTPARFAEAAEADEEYSRWWRREFSLIPEGVSERLAARKAQLVSRGFTVPADLEELEAKGWDIINNRLPAHPRRDAVKQWYLRWLDPDDPIIEDGWPETHAYNRTYTKPDNSTWRAYDISEYLTIASEMTTLGWLHPVRVADMAAEVIFATWIIRAAQDGSLADVAY